MKFNLEKSQSEDFRVSTSAERATHRGPTVPHRLWLWCAWDGLGKPYLSSMQHCCLVLPCSFLSGGGREARHIQSFDYLQGNKHMWAYWNGPSKSTICKICFAQRMFSVGSWSGPSQPPVHKPIKTRCLFFTMD